MKASAGDNMTSASSSEPPSNRFLAAAKDTSLRFRLFVLFMCILFIPCVLLFGIEGALIPAIPIIVFYSIRYIWWRLVWEPFGMRGLLPTTDENATIEVGEKWKGYRGHGDYTAIHEETRKICCPKNFNWRNVWKERSVWYLMASFLFWLVLVMSVLGVALSSTAHQSTKPPLGIVICYNIAGAVAVLIVSIWVVDTIALLLVVTGVAFRKIQLLLGYENHHPTGKVLNSSCDEEFEKANSHDNDQGSVALDKQEKGEYRSVPNGKPVPSLELVVSNGDEAFLGADESASKGYISKANSDVVPKDEKTEEEVVLGNDAVEHNNSEANPSNASPVASKPERVTRLRIRRLKALLSMCVFIIFMTLSTLDSYGDPRAIHISIPLRQLPPCLDGFKLALLTDVHAGAMTGDEDVRRVVSLVQAWQPHLVAISGDIGDQPVNGALKEKLDPLRDLVDTSHGVFWAPGNHENVDIDGYRELFSESQKGSPLDFIVQLENARRSIPFHGDTNCSLDIAGLADESGHEDIVSEGQVAPDLNKTLHGRDPSRPLLLLNHQPVHFERYARAGVGLVLSGHTHGGQIFPNHALLWFVYGTYISGLFSSDANVDLAPTNSKDLPAYLYVSEGTIGWGPRVRLFSYPEITYITLRSPDVYRAEGGSTEEDEEYRVAVVALFVGLVALPLAALVCLTRSCGYFRCEKEAARGWFRACRIKSEHLHETL